MHRPHFSATASYQLDLPDVPSLRQDEFIDVTNPKHPCYSGHQHIWRQDERQWRCTRCGNPDMTGRPAPTVPNPTFPPMYPMPVLPLTPSPYQPPTFPMTPGRIDVTYTSDGTGCLWDRLSPEDRGRPMGLSCPCPRCSPRC